MGSAPRTVAAKQRNHDDPTQNREPAPGWRNGGRRCLAVVPPANAIDGLLVIQNTGNGKCLQPENASLFQGVAIVQEPCNGSAAQLWYPIYSNPANGNYVEGFKNLHSLLCLDARGGATNGTPVQQWTCNSISNEKWLAGIPPYVGPVLSRVSGTSTHCLDDPNQSAQDGTAMQLFAVNRTAAQSWFVGPSPV
jgi:hypothetical protein